jgi:hypothetical protein
LESPPESSPPSIGRERTTTPNPRAHDDDTRRKQKQPKIQKKKSEIKDTKSIAGGNGKEKSKLGNHEKKETNDIIELYRARAEWKSNQMEVAISEGWG